MINEKNNRNIDSKVLEIRSIAGCIVLSIITIGIYELIWIYKIMHRIKLIKGDNSSVTGEFLLFIFIPFYSLYWVYTRSKKLFEGASDLSVKLSEDNAVVNLVLFVVNLGIVAIALLQNDLNTIATKITNNAVDDMNYETENNSNDINVEFTDVDKLKVKLSEIKTLCDNGLISKEDYERKKTELIDKY